MKLWRDSKRVDDLRHHRIFVAQHARKQRLAAFHLGNQVFAKFVLDRAAGEFGFRERALAKFPEGAGRFLLDSGKRSPL